MQPERGRKRQQARGQNRGPDKTRSVFFGIKQRQHLNRRPVQCRQGQAGKQRRKQIDFKRYGTQGKERERLGQQVVDGKPRGVTDAQGVGADDKFR